MSARNRELMALIPASLLLTAGFAAIFIQRSEVLSNVSLTYGAIFLGLCFAGHMVIRFTLPYADPYLFPLVAILACFGLVVVYRIDEELARDQAQWFVIGLIVFVITIVALRDFRILERYRYTIALAGLALLVLPRVPGIGQQVNGAYLGVKVGPISFQPAEFGKVLIVIFLASYLADKRELLAAGSGRFSLPRAKDLGPLMIAWATSLAVLFLEKDLGASLLYFAVFVVMLWIASGRPMFLIVGLGLFVVGAWIGYLALSHVQLRVDYWLNALNPDKVYQLGYGQLAQGWFGMASGGIVGTGLGLGSPILIPYAATDFIFAAIGEELGLLGTSALLLIYLALIGRSLRVAVERDDAFGKLLATGLTTIVAVQTFVIVGGVTRLIPLTGITLPFVSYGGSSLVANFVILALLIRVSAGPWYRKVTT